MAGMFYSLQEAAEKLNKTEDQLKEMVKQGKLHEFRDGQNLLFKVSEVEALAADEGVPIKIEDVEQPLEPEPAEAPETQEAPEEEILLAPETAAPAAEGGLTDADTAFTSEGINVLGETDKDYQITDDTMAETTGAMEKTGAPGTMPETPLEEIEEDVNLDTIGSGSGLLDLSLQADDTSLGGILDEIYTAEGGEAQEPAEASSAVEMVAEAEQMLPEADLAVPQPAQEILATGQQYIEPATDVQSNTLGMLLFLPLLALLYTAVVAMAGQRGVMPSILVAIQGVIWYIVIGAIVAAGLVVGAAFFWLSGSPGKAIKKSPTPKKAKTKKAPPQVPEETTA